MAEHYTRNTVMVKAWCQKCSADTFHDVNGKRKGACQPCVAKLEAEKKRLDAIPPPAKQGNLF